MIDFKAITSKSVTGIRINPFCFKEPHVVQRPPGVNICVRMSSQASGRLILIPDHVRIASGSTIDYFINEMGCSRSSENSLELIPVVLPP